MFLDQGTAATAAGAPSSMEEKRVGVKKVLFVCTANMIRSPMAMGLLQDRLARSSWRERVEVGSAGVWAVDNGFASPVAVEVLNRDYGIDISGHRTRRLTPELIRATDLIVVMEEDHRQAIFYRTPQYVDRVVLMTELAGYHEDIRDLVAQDLQEYSELAQELADLVDAGWAMLVRLLGLS